jgi:uncharacterized protein YecT (DUF1311 family)
MAAGVRQRRRLAAALAGAALAAGAAPAEEGAFVPGPYIEILADCYGAAKTAAARSGCIGEASGICIEEEPRGRSDRGRIACFGIEADAWDVVLGGEYRLAMAWARAADAARPPPAPDLPRREDALRVAQRAWDDFREAECRLAFARAGPVGTAACQLDMIARRALDLRAMRED